MTVNLTPELEAFVQSQLRAGQFASADDLVRQAIGRLRDEEAALADLEADADEDQAAIEEAESQIAAGLDRPLDEVDAELRRKHFGA